MANMYCTRVSIYSNRSIRVFVGTAREKTERNIIYIYIPARVGLVKFSVRFYVRRAPSIV